MKTWLRWWSGDEPAQSLALVRVLVGLAVLSDLATMAWVGALGPAWSLTTSGGIVDATRKDLPLVAMASDPALLLWGTMVASALAFTVGWGSRAALVVFGLASAQSALHYPMGDRAIDMLLRNAIWILAASGCGATLSLSARLRSGTWMPAVEVPAWPRRLLVLQLVVMYFTAGVQKFGLLWMPMGDFAALYVILHDWGVTRAIPTWAHNPVGFFVLQLGTASTLIWQWTYPVVLVAPALARQPTPWGRWLARWRPERAWVALGVVFHLGIAATLDLGLFPWGMLALYPALWDPRGQATGLRGT